MQELSQTLQLRTRRLSTQLKVLAMLTLTALIVTGCAGSNLPASVSGGECRVFVAAAHEMIGKTRYDQEWIDQTIESGVAACGWPRPKARPKNWDDVRSYAKEVAAAPVQQRRGVIQRIKDKFKRKPAPVASVPAPKRVEVVSSPPVAPAPQPQPQPVAKVYEPTPTVMQPIRVIPLKKQEPADELLGIQR
jgi:hypothetical protein